MSNLLHTCVFLENKNAQNVSNLDESGLTSNHFYEKHLKVTHSKLRVILDLPLAFEVPTSETFATIQSVDNILSPYR